MSRSARNVCGRSSGIEDRLYGATPGSDQSGRLECDRKLLDLIATWSTFPTERRTPCPTRGSRCTRSDRFLFRCVWEPRTGRSPNPGLWKEKLAQLRKLAAAQGLLDNKTTTMSKSPLGRHRNLKRESKSRNREEKNGDKGKNEAQRQEFGFSSVQKTHLFPSCLSVREKVKKSFPPGFRLRTRGRKEPGRASRRNAGGTPLFFSFRTDGEE